MSPADHATNTNRLATVRCKMRVIENDRSEPTLARISLNAVDDLSALSVEGGSYVDAIAQGTIRFKIMIPEIADKFIEGEDYYVDFVRVSEIEEKRMHVL